MSYCLKQQVWLCNKVCSYRLFEVTAGLGFEEWWLLLYMSELFVSVARPSVPSAVMSAEDLIPSDGLDGFKGR